jgi:hypothetical protein
MGAPSNARTGNQLTIEITAGAAILPTWNAAYTLAGGAGPAIPNGGILAIRFRYNGSAWIEQGRSSDPDHRGPHRRGYGGRERGER